MANEKGQVDIGFKADISNLTQQLANVSGITDKEAKAMVKSLQLSYSKMEREAKKSAKKQQDSFKGFKESWTELNSKLELIGKAYNKLVQPIISYLGVQAEAIDQIADLSAKTQISGDNIQALQMAFEQTGLTFEQVDSLLTTFSTNLGKAATIGGKAEKGFKLLNIETRDAHGVIRDTNEVFTEAISKIGELSTAQEQGAAAAQLMGSEGKNLLTAFGDVSNFETYLELAEKFGVDVGPDAAEAAAKWETANYALGLSFKHVGNQVFKSIGGDATTGLKLFGGAVVYASTFAIEVLKELGAFIEDRFVPIFSLLGKIGSGEASFKDLTEAAASFGKILASPVLGVIEFGSALSKANSIATQSTEDFFVLGWQLDNVAQNSTKAEQNLGKLSKTIDGSRKFYEDADKALQQYLDSSYKEQDILNDLDAQISESVNKQLGEEGKIQAALDQKILKLREVSDEYWYIQEVAEKTAQLEALAHKDAANDWLAYEKETLEKSSSELKAHFETLLDAMDQFDQKAHEIFNAEVVEPIMKPINAVQGGLSGIAGMIGGSFWGPLASGLMDAFLNSRETIAQLKEELMSIPDILEELPGLALDLAETVLKDFAPSLVKSLPALVEGLSEMIPSVIYSIIDSIPLIVDSLIEAVPLIIYAMIDNLDDFILAMIQLMPRVAWALVKGIVDFFIGVIPEMAKAFWEGLKDFFVPDEFFKGEEKKKSRPVIDFVKEIVTLGFADTATYNDTPGVVKAGPQGMRARLGAGDYMAAARNPADLLKQAMEAQPQREQIVSGGGYVQWADGAFAYDSFTKRHIRKKGAIYRQLYGRAA